MLVDALPDVRPAMSLEQLRHDVQVGSPAADIISISANGKNAADAEATANAVAHSYIAYVGSAKSPVGHVSAQLAIVGDECIGALAHGADESFSRCWARWSAA